MKFLLDTNAIAEPLRRQPSRAFLRRLRIHGAELAISSVTWHEALFGMARMPEGRRKKLVRDYLLEVIQPTMPVLPYDRAAAEWHARERARLEGRGHVLPFADGQIAAVAVANRLTLVTANVRDFKLLSEVVVVNWAAD